MLFRWLTLCLCCGCLGLLEAQDLHFSQFYHHPMHYSPALTGAFEGEVRAMGLARSQWTSVPVSYQSLALGADRKVWARGKNGSFFRSNLCKQPHLTALSLGALPTALRRI
ncbi:MAG: type IX secretion system membrane protein PorP/SprF [Saprospiraceae bacterium]|nr:type IX secretion system membrane protein PorP/SprF [Saprospiraceae bacterium]MDW8230752.1 type IX secretion system membrane protein PorP/SprF [Saprospiraceae bacterium]